MAAIFASHGRGQPEHIARLCATGRKLKARCQKVMTLASARVSAADGFVLLTSQVSVELIQKAARLGAPVVVAVSAPTSAGIRLAEACGITLAAIARGQDFEVFTHFERIFDRAVHHVA